MKLHELQPAAGSVTAPKRLGRGVAVVHKDAGQAGFLSQAQEHGRRRGHHYPGARPPAGFCPLRRFRRVLELRLARGFPAALQGIPGVAVFTFRHIGVGLIHLQSPAAGFAF